MQKSVEHIFQDILNYKTLGIFGDYDVDGAASTALLIKFFEHIGHPFKFYIPNRVTEGYGPSIKAFEKLMKNNLSTIITVDCGTLSYKSIDYANLNKVNIIVIDHHQAEPNLPKAFSIRYDLLKSYFDPLSIDQLYFGFQSILSSRVSKDQKFEKTFFQLY